jgi:hypothetical protein
LASAASLALAALALVAAVAGGLLMACPAAPPPGTPTWLLAGASSHAALMICGFLGTMIGLERAVAVGSPLAFTGPVASAAAVALTLTGQPALGAAVFVLSSGCLLVTSLAILRRQAAAHTVLLAVAALAWLAGCVVHSTHTGSPIACWFAFLVLTIGAERLEMTRLTRRRRGATQQLFLVAAAMLTGAAASSLPIPASAVGLALFGASLVLLSIWLFVHDIARRTLATEGLGRFMAIALLLGYGWLAVAGAGWIALSLGLTVRDLALHALALGFVVSMMMGHAPVILPALTRLRPKFGAAFYMPLAALHASLVVRLGAVSGDVIQRGVGATLNVIALILFVVTLAGAVIARLAERRRVSTFEST